MGVEEICQEWSVGICKKRPKGNYDPNKYPVNCQDCNIKHTTTTMPVLDDLTVKRLLLNEVYPPSQAKT
jgi:hypothetical protein